MNPQRVLIIGGGLAGMACAVALNSAGLHVTLVEARKSLGGRAGSFEDPVTGEILDNCQHVLLGCCTNLIDFYRRTLATHLIRFERAIHFMDSRGRGYALSGVRGLPAPLHLGPAMARFGLLSLAERAAIAGAMLAMMALSPADLAKLDDVSFGDWLDSHHQPIGAVHKLYDPIVISGLNEQTRAGSAAYAIKIFRDSLLANAAGYVMGLPTATLASLYESVPVGDVRLSMRIARLLHDGQRLTGAQTTDGQTIAADAVVIAMNHHNLPKLIPEALRARETRLENLNRFESVPILGAHLWFDRPVLATPHVALVEGPLQWLFRKDADGAALHGVISAARDWLAVPKDEALRQFETQVRQTLPQARDARLQRGVVVIEKRATFSPLPGLDRLRPTQSPGKSDIANLFLAGDYTKTGWPATMEGAVRSGYLAAEGVWTMLNNTPRRWLVPDLSPQWPAQLMAQWSKMQL